MEVPKLVRPSVVSAAADCFAMLLVSFVLLGFIAALSVGEKVMSNGHRSAALPEERHLNPTSSASASNRVFQSI